MFKKKIILCSNISESEKLKSLALFNERTFDVHYMDTLSLAEYLLILSGESHHKKFISNGDLSAMIYNDVRNIKYFSKSSLIDIRNIIRSINDLRHYIVSDEAEAINKLPLNNFKEKNEAVKEVYRIMMNALGDEYIDEIGVIRYTLEHSKSFPEIDFVIYEGSNLLKYPLDMALLNKAQGKEVLPSKIDHNNKRLIINSYTKAFGQTNEIENILSYIYKNKIPFDKCLIVSSNTQDYAKILSNYCAMLNFPLALGVGVNVVETNPGQMFTNIHSWEESLNHGEYLRRLINDKSFNLDKLKQDLETPESFDEINKSLTFPYVVSFDSIIETAGELRMSFDVVKNNTKRDQYITLLKQHEKEKYDEEDTSRRLAELPFVERLINILDNGMISLLREYTSINDQLKDGNALEKIIKLLSFEEKYHISHSDIVKAINKESVGRESIKPEALYFTSIDRAASCLRPYLFIVGLSSNTFPGKNTEDPILLDEDYKVFGEDNASNRGINDNRNMYHALIEEANKYDVNIHLSYAYYNSETLKTQNASSVMFETYRKENGLTRTIKEFDDEFKNKESTKFKKVEFFDSDVLPTYEIGKALVDNKKVAFNEPASLTKEEFDQLSEKVLKACGLKGFSASAINNFATCPYYFFLSNILKIPQPDEVDIYELIPANHYGTIAHYLLENLDKNETSVQEFVEISKQRLREYFVFHQTENIPLMESVIDEFGEVMATAYDMEGSEKTAFREEDITTTHSSGISIHGFPDKVVDNGDGTYKVIDYKTGRTIKHDPNNMKTMLQCVVYAYIIEKELKKKVTGFEYWYLKLGQKVKSDQAGHTMEDYFNELNNVLTELKAALDTGHFDPDTSACSNCYSSAICPRRKK